MAFETISNPKPIIKVRQPPNRFLNHPPTPPSSPPLPTPRTITELLSIRAKKLPGEPIIAYPSTGIEYVEYTFSQLETLSVRAAELYSSRLPIRSNPDDNAHVIALLGVSNLDYLINVLGLTRLGFTVLFLSTRLSEAAYLSLLAATGCQNMIVDKSFQKTAKLLKDAAPDLSLHNILSGPEYSSRSLREHSLPSLDFDKETSKIAWIIHSSGSTGLPKPIRQTHSAALKNYEQNMNLRGFITLPLFHAHGLSSVFRAITSIKKIYMYSASLPLTSHNLLQIMGQHSFEIFYGVPYALKLLSESLEGIEALARMKVVMFGGSACPDTLGDILVDKGVNLISHYGTTETGQLMTSFRPSGDKGWNYVRVHDSLAPFIRWETRGANMYELCVLDGWPSKVATNRDDGSYATKDLFEPHPVTAGAWKYAGRLDDTIVLMNGEKAIPIAMEQAVRQNKLVREAIMFGTGKSQLGMMVVASDLAGQMTVEELVGNLWPIIELENRTMPAYAQLSRDMIQVLPAGTIFPQTDKGTVIRQTFYRTFQKQIEEVYQRLETRTAGTKVLNLAEMISFLRGETTKLLGQEDFVLEDSTDLFMVGVDSLQSTRLRSRILQEIQLYGHSLPQNVVFEYPTLTRLASAIIGIREGRTREIEDPAIHMQQLVAKYSDLPAHIPVKRETTENCVIVTGATGSLGAHIVAQLASNPAVSEVCGLVRANTSESAQSRVIMSMKQRAVYQTLSPSARCKIVCHASDFSKPNLGLSSTIYNTLSGKIISLIHCAWSVNFNKALSSFEPDCIAGARHLMMLCLSAKSPVPASFNFCSSVSTVVSTPGLFIPEKLPASFACAQNMGYAQSKLVTEHLIAAAVSQTGLRGRVLRVGQIVADTTHGIWNDTEAIPLMLQAATTIGALPALDESPRWLPVDLVASTCIDISLSSSQEVFYNVVNPKSFHWTKSLLPALTAAGLHFREVGQREWIELLRKSNHDVEVNPTFKLVEFFTNKYDNEVTQRKNFDYSTSHAERLSPTLSTVPALDPELVDKFVKHFLATSWSLKSISSG